MGSCTGFWKIIMSFNIPHLTLNNGINIPKLGLGLYKIEGKKVERAVNWAIEAGYRHFDTAALYGNENELGLALKKCGINREELFITTKLYPTNFLWTETAFENSLAKLKTDYIDLYLIHWPGPGKDFAWKIMEQIYEKKLVRAIGVSNYYSEDLEELFSSAKVIPAVNQMEFHPFKNDQSLLEFCVNRGIAFEAYSPLNRGYNLEHPFLINLAKKYNKTTAQIMLRWSIQHGSIVIPKSEKKERIIENSKVFDFNIEAEDLLALNALSA